MRHRGWSACTVYHVISPSDQVVWSRALCQELAGSSQQLVNSFGIDDHLLAAPIAGDWVRPAAPCPAQV